MSWFRAPPPEHWRNPREIGGFVRFLVDECVGGFGNPKEGRRHYSLITFGQSDREAVSSFEFDCRWKYAAGGLPLDYPGFAGPYIPEFVGCEEVVLGVSVGYSAEVVAGGGFGEFVGELHA